MLLPTTTALYKCPKCGITLRCSIPILGHNILYCNPCAKLMEVVAGSFEPIKQEKENNNVSKA